MVVIKEVDRLAFSHGGKGKHFYFKPGWWWWTQSKIWETSKALFSGISHIRLNTQLGSLIEFHLRQKLFYFQMTFNHDVQTF